MPPQLRILSPSTILSQVHIVLVYNEVLDTLTYIRVIQIWAIYLYIIISLTEEALS